MAYSGAYGYYPYQAARANLLWRYVEMFKDNCGNRSS